MTDAVVETIAQEPAEQKPLTFVEQVNNAVGNLVEQEDGSFALPEDTEYSDELRYATVSEKRRRDSQSALNKSQHALKTTKAETEALRKRLQGTAKVTLSTEEAEELEELKFSDPDKWRTRMNELETRAATEFNNELAEVTDQVGLDSEIERRVTLLDQFNKENPDSQITETVVANDVPPRITTKLAEGKITFEDFLVEVKTYLGKGKAVKQEKTSGQPDLGELGGGDKASEHAVLTDADSSYENEIF